MKFANTAAPLTDDLTIAEGTLPEKALPPALASDQGKHKIPSPALLFLWVCAAFCARDAFMNLLAPSLFGMSRTHEWPFGTVADPFRDFYLYKPRYQFFHSPQFFSFDGWAYMYPAPLAVVSKFFYLAPHSTAFFIAFMIACFFSAVCLFGYTLIKRGIRARSAVFFVLLAALTTNAFVADVQQGNVECVLWLLMSLGLWAFFTGHARRAAICIGIAASMKF